MNRLSNSDALPGLSADDPDGLSAVVNGHRNGKPARERGVVVVLEERRLIRECLIRSINDAGRFEALAAASLDECLWLTLDREVLVVLLCLSGPAHSEENRNAVRRAVDALSEQPLLVLTDGHSLPQSEDQSQHRPCGYIDTSMSIDVALAALRVAHIGAATPKKCGGALAGNPNGICHKSQPCTSHKLASDVSTDEAPARNKISCMFTTKQVAVVEALRKGKANKIIAYELNMKESTVKVHVRNIMKRLNATNRTEVSYIAARLEAGEFPSQRHSTAHN